MYRKKASLKQLEWISFIIIMIILFFSTQTYFGTENYSRLYKLDLFFVILLLGLTIAANYGVIRYRRRELFSYTVVLIPNLLLFGISFYCYQRYHKISFSTFISSSLKPILICIMAIVAYYSFGKKTIKGIMIAGVVNYAIYIVTCMIQYGPLSLFQAGMETDASKLLEVHEITFVFGIIIVYLFMDDYFIEAKKRWIVLLTIFCLLGFKRILIAAMAVGLAAFIVMKRFEKPKLLMFSSVLSIVISLIWVYLCSSWSAFTGLSVMLGIDTKGRNWIYQGFYSYYSFSPSYIGSGMGYVQELIFTIPSMFMGGHYIGLHNEFMRLFIELGFYPYLFYFVLLLPVMIKMIFRKRGSMAAVKYFILWAVTLICMTTDNQYPNYMLVLYILILICINEMPEKSKKRTKKEKNDG